MNAERDHNVTFEERWAAMTARRIEQERRRTEDRLRVIVTLVSEPDPDDVAAFFYVQVKASRRLHQVMTEFQARHPWHRADFDVASPNVLPQHGEQFYITEMGLFLTTGRWGPDDWCDEDGVRVALDDLVYGLSGYHAQVQFARA